MKYANYILSLLILTITCLVFHFINFNVTELNNSFYLGKDGGSFAYFNIFLITCVICSLILFKNVVYGLLFGLINGILLPILTYWLYFTIFDSSNTFYHANFCLFAWVLILLLFSVKSKKTIEEFSVARLILNVIILIGFVVLVNFNLITKNNSSFDEVLKWILD